MEEDPRAVEAIVMVWGIDICDYYALYEITPDQHAYFERAMHVGAGSKENALANVVLGTALPERSDRKDKAYAVALKHRVLRTNKVMFASSVMEAAVGVRHDPRGKFYAITAL